MAARTSFSSLQGMVSKPKGPYDPILRKTTGPDGKLYVLEDPRDYGKYHVLDDREVMEELLKSQDAALAKRAPPLRGSSSSPGRKASGAQAKSSWTATMDDKTGAQSRVRDLLSTSREDHRAASKSPPGSPAYSKAVGALSRSILSESQDKSSLTARQSLDGGRPPRPVSAAAVVASARGRPATAGHLRKSESKAEGSEQQANAQQQQQQQQQQRRSLSAGKSRLLDNEAYLLRKQWEEERQVLVEKERQQYLQELHDRTLRASKNGKEFAAMHKRAERAAERNAQKALEKKIKAEAAEAKERQDRDALRKAHLSKTLSKDGALSWKEIQEQNELRRRERVEKRKQELALVSSAPSGAFVDAQSKKEAAVRLALEQAKAGTQFKAEDPAKVAEKLSRMQRAWEAKAEAEKEKARAREMARINGGASAGKARDSGMAAMEARAAAAKARSDAREARRVAAEAAEDQKRKDEERARVEKIFNMKVPESGRRLTRAAENRAKLVKSQMDKEKADLEREARDKAKKDRVARDMAITLKAIVGERERERREKMKGSFTELSKTEAAAAEASAALMAAYRKNLADNKAKLLQARSNAPSLMERHEQDMATRKAGNNALSKVARAVKGTGLQLRGKFSLDEDDLFSDHEKLKLTSRSEA